MRNLSLKKSKIILSIAYAFLLLTVLLKQFSYGLYLDMALLFFGCFALVTAGQAVAFHVGKKCRLQFFILGGASILKGLFFFAFELFTAIFNISFVNTATSVRAIFTIIYLVAIVVVAAAEIFCAFLTNVEE